MPVLTRGDSSLLFVHIPKTGGATLLQCFRSAGWDISHICTDASALRLMRCSPQHHHAELLSELFRLDRFDLIFSVTRHPLTRLKSEYVFRMARRQRDDVARVSRFDAWALDVLKRERDNPYFLDNHLRPQVEFQLPGAITFRFEDGIDQVVSALGQRLRTRISLDKIHRNKAPVRLSHVSVSPSTITLVKQRYLADFESFGYAFPASG